MSDDLRAHPDIIMRSEPFGNPVLAGGLEQTDDNRIRFLRSFWKSYRPEVEETDDRFRGLSVSITRSRDQFARPKRLVNIALSYAPAVIILRRENMLEQAVSILRAQSLQAARTEREAAAGDAGLSDEDKTELTKLRRAKTRMPIEALRREIKGITTVHKAIDEIAEGFGPVLELTFEEYLEDRAGVMSSVYHHIGAKPFELTTKPTPPLVTPGGLEDVVANYAAVEKFAEGQNFEPLF